MINHLVNQQYEVLEKIGDSPLSAVYKARDKSTNRIVALKTLQPPYAQDAAFVAAFQNGFRATTPLNHPNIVRFYETGQEGGTPYAVVEFVRGINLKERIRRIAPFTVSVAVDFGCALCEALHYAHNAGLAHGDLRPQNIIISPEGVLKVTDFGTHTAFANHPAALAEILQRAAHYHAPELSIRQPGTVAGDLYAVGAIFYEMLTGNPLYSGDTPEAIADHHAFSPIPSPRDLNPAVPRAMEGIIFKCLQKRPNQRYTSAAELLTDLKAVRDALRFGKTLSWSPMEIQRLAEEAAHTGAEAKAASVVPVPPPAPAPATTPVAATPAPSVSDAMPTKNRLRAQQERVSIYVRLAIAAVTALILVCLIAVAGIWVSYWAVPKPVAVPEIVGKPIDDVRTMAQKLKISLKEHAEFNDKPRNIIFRTSQPKGTQLRPSQSLEVWYSKGPAYVNVPDLVKLSRDQAEKKLEEVGLTLGKVVTAYSKDIPLNAVVRQNPPAKNRVFQETTVNLVISDGPKPEYVDEKPPEPLPNSDPNNPTPEPGTEPVLNPDTLGPPQEFDRSIRIQDDGKGVRQVRIIYKDALGWHDSVPIIDEAHNEGDKIPLLFNYYGKMITLRIFYDGEQVKELTFDPQATRDKRVQ